MEGTVRKGALGKGECGMLEPKAKANGLQKPQPLFQTQPQTHPGASHRSPNPWFPCPLLVRAVGTQEHSFKGERCTVQLAKHSVGAHGQAEG